MISIFKTIKASSKCTSILGINPTKFYPFLSAPQCGKTPYVVWQIVGGEPFNELGSVPASDSYTIQIDAYAHSASDAREAAIAVRDALEADRKYTVVAWRGESYESDTKLYRVNFDVDVIHDRN